MQNNKLLGYIYLRGDSTSQFFVEDKNYEVARVQGMRSGLKTVDDIYMPLLIKNLDLVKQMRVRSDDTFVIGFPKSGTTWLEEIV
jgi:hypothetical protein